MIYRYDRRGRTTATVLILLAIWAVLVWAWAILNMALWIGLILAAFTLPALWDVIRNTHSWVEVSESRISWQSALRSGDRSDINHVRLDRRFDGGMKITLIHIGGAHTRLPPDISPPADAFEAALTEAGISAERHPFSVF